MNCLSLIQQRYPSMSPVEKRIADCILSEPEKVMNSTLVSVAVRAKVSEGSIVNFANSLGYKGFSQLKINLAQNVSAYNTQDEITREDSPKQVLRKLIDRSIASFESTYDTLGHELQEAADLLMRAEKIIVVGIARSVAVARDLSIRMMRIGLPAVTETDPLLAGIMSMQMKEGDVLFAVSGSGRTRELLMIAERARKAGAKVICLTSHPNSPLTNMSDISLVAVSIEAQNYREAATSRLSQLLIGDCLIEFLANQTREGAILNMDRMEEVYEQHRESIS